MTSRRFILLFVALLVMIGITSIAIGFSMGPVLRNFQHQELERNLREKALMLANRVNTDRSAGLQAIVSQEAHASGARATVVDPTGKVLADSEESAPSMDKLLGAVEIQAALRGEVGVDTRRTQALAIPILYVAVPVAGGAARLAYPLADPDIPGIRNAMLAASGIACLLALLLAAFASRWKPEQWGGMPDQEAGKISANHTESGELPSLPGKSLLDPDGMIALQQQQQQLESLLNSMQEGVIAIGPDELVQWANLRMEKLAPIRIRVNAPVIETVRDPDFLRAVREASERRMPITTRATSILPGHTFDVTATPLPGGGAVVVLRDLTETERVEKTRRDFIANVSHELRTPLTSIQGYAETLLDAATENNHSRDFLEIIRKNAARMSRLTEDLLTLARVESGEQRFDIRPVSTTELLDEAVQNFKDVAGAQGIELRVADQSVAVVQADPEAIQQVFSNLIENAIKYAASSKTIDLASRSIEGGVEFRVRDFGPGISSEHLPRLFERFYRVDRARSRESGGTGLGLAIAKHIVLAHEGTIRAESELNHGSAFLFTLPLASDAGVVQRQVHKETI